MSKKKKEVSATVEKEVSATVEEVTASSGENTCAESVQEPIYLREVLFQFDEIKQYGLNQYFLRAILKDKYYTLNDAHRLIRNAL